jgi:hypothetical protein
LTDPTANRYPPAATTSRQPNTIPFALWAFTFNFAPSDARTLNQSYR